MASGLTEIGDPLVHPGYERLALRTVHEQLARAPDRDSIQWSGISDELAQAMTLELTPHWYGSSEDCILDLPSSWEEFRARLKRSIRLYYSGFDPGLGALQRHDDHAG
jgi:hypothetical protein